MRYNAVYISGNLISQELIDKLDDDSAEGQRPADFGLETGTRVRQDIARAWTDANDYWKIFKRKSDALKDTEKGTTETRNLWTIPLLSLLGYDLRYQQQAEVINEKSYEISHRTGNRGDYPVMIVSVKDELDKKPEGNTRYRMSPHALLQEYLNVTEHTYGLVTNGKLIRLLRDNGRITRLTYLEFNLEKIFEEDLYADFALLYRLLHVSRMPDTQTAAKESIIDKYYEQAIEAGTRIRGSLSKAVEEAIKVFANGLLRHPDNTALREALQHQQLTELDFYQAQLRLIYRLLFVMTIEERRLVYPENIDVEQIRLSEIYYNYYSLQQLRNLSGKKQFVTPLHHNLYIQLWHNFKLFESGKYAQKLGMQALGSGVFEPGNLGLLDECKMYNRDLLDALYLISYFTDEESGQHIRVNYGALNVEEFGSVYEGLLEYKAAVTEIDGQWQFNFVLSDERSKSGSHYTPEELVQPLIKHSLEYLIEDRLKEKDPVVALLSLKVCDVACGSGHILLSAARRIALEVARKQFNEEQPSPAHLRWATRKVINHCIYGVDKNPLAVELCKLAMWLEAHNPGEPLNFLDHHIKCGDAIVGLAHKEELEKGIADEAFKALPGDDKAIASSFLKRNKQERKQPAQNELDFETTTKAELDAVIEQYKLFKNLPERTPEEVTNKEKQYKKYEQDYHRIRIKQLADAQVAQFFIAKNDANKPNLLTDAEYRSFLRQVNKHMGVLQSNKLAKAESVAKEEKFFHWFLEFPEVFNGGGFDCIVGNPPFLNGLRITTNFGVQYYSYIKEVYSPVERAADLVSFFFRRNFTIIKKSCFISLIATNSISQSDTKRSSLDIILNNFGEIVFARKSIKWPGLASVHVTLLTIVKGPRILRKYLENKQVTNISSFLEEEEQPLIEYTILANKDISFQGSIILGNGFTVTEEFAKERITKDPKYSKVLLPYIIGDELQSDPQQKAARWVINFHNWPLEKCAKEFPDLLEIVRCNVKPQRDLVKRQAYRNNWWFYAEKGVKLYEALENIKFVFGIPTQATKYVQFSKIDKGVVFSNAIAVIADDRFETFALLNNSIHDNWVWKLCSTMENNSVRYSPTKCFQTFPFPKNILTVASKQLEQLGEIYHNHRLGLMHKLNLGLTKIYNAFNGREIQRDFFTSTLKVLDNKEIGKQHGKEVWNLWSHLQKKEGTCSIEEAITGIVKLRELHVQMDNAVLEAYGWSDILLRHDFYEVDYLPENDRIRFTIHPDARKEVLKRLFELNHKIHEEEVKAGLWDKKGGKKKGYKTNDEVSRGGEPDEGLGGLFGQQKNY